MTDNHGVDVVYDPVGMIVGEFLPSTRQNHIQSFIILDSLKCIAWKGRALVVGFAAGNIEKVCNAMNFSLHVLTKPRYP